MAFYDLHTFERPGRPARAIVLSAAFLAATVGFAMGLIHLRQRAIDVELEEARTLHSWPVRVRPPAGWKTVSGEELTEGVGLLLEESGNRGRLLAYVRGPVAGSPGLISEASDALQDTVKALADTDVILQEDLDIAPFGTLCGGRALWTDPRHRGNTVLGMFGRTPQGEIYAVLLRCPQGPERSDMRFLQRVAEGIELTSLNLTTDVATAARRCGLQFDPPTDVQACVTGDSLPVRTLQLFSNATSKQAWSAEIRLFPIAPGRNPREILTDISRNYRGSMDPQYVVQAVSLAGRQAYHDTISNDPSLWAVDLWLVPLNAQCAVLFNGWSEGGTSSLAAVGEKIAGSVRITDDTLIPDMETARQRGIELLEEIRRDCLDRWFAKWSESPPTYLIKHGGQVRGYTQVNYSRYRSDPALGMWQTELEQRRERTGGQILLYRCKTVVDKEGLGYSTTATRTEYTRGPRGEEASEQEHFQETRKAGEDTISKSVEMGRNTYRHRITVDNTFACDPLTDVVATMVAEDPQLRPAVITTTTWQTPNLVTQMIWPLGEQVIPGSDPPTKAPAVLVQTDSQTDLYTFYFDDTGEIRFMDLGEQTHMSRCTEEDLDRLFSASLRRIVPRGTRGGRTW